MEEPQSFHRQSRGAGVAEGSEHAGKKQKREVKLKSMKPQTGNMRKDADAGGAVSLREQQQRFLRAEMIHLRPRRDISAVLGVGLDPRWLCC